MAAHWANSSANVFLYHQPERSAFSRYQNQNQNPFSRKSEQNCNPAFLVCRADDSVPLDLQFMFGTPLHPISFQRFSSSDRRLSLAAMTYVSSFVRTGSVL